MMFVRNMFAVAGGVTITATIIVLLLSVVTLITMTGLLPVVGLAALLSG